MERLPTDILRQLDTFALRTRRAVIGLRQGTHRSIRRGHGVEFAEYRQYELGDNPRYIDWNLFARSDKLYIKRYLEEENVALFIVIDGSNSMAHPALRQKWVAAGYLARCIGYVALASQDPVWITVLGGQTAGPFWGGKAFHALEKHVHSLEDRESEIGNEAPLEAEARRAAGRMRFPGICVFISDFLYPVSRAASLLSAFSSRNMEIHAVQVLSTSDLDPAPGSDGATLSDSETGEQLPISLTPEDRDRYRSTLETHNRSVRDYCLSHNIQFSSIIPTEPFAQSGVDLLNTMSLFV